MPASRAKAITHPAPIGGWNTRDAKASMPKEDATILTNLFPDVGNVVLRNGHASHATGMTGNVETIAEYHSGSTRKMLSAAASNIWDATAASAASSLASGFTSDRWQWANMNGSMGFVNGADAPQVYDGSTVGAMTISGSGLTTTTLDGIFVFKSRSYFWASTTQDFWYSATNALGGALTKFPLSRVSQFGGNLTIVTSFSSDSGSGPDDFIVFIMSSGDAIVYQGSDPGSASDWSLVGIYRIGSPLSIRSAVKIGGDTFIITRDDYVSLSEMFREDRTTRKRSKAVGALQSAVASYASNFGWQAIAYPKGRMLIFNIPRTTTTFDQHVRNISTGAWCKFTGINAHCWGMYSDNLYIGGVGVIYRADSGYSDNNSAIEADGMTSWSLLGTSLNKQVTAVQNHIETNVSTVNLGIATGADFTDPMVSADETTEAPDTTPWGSPWGSSWGSSFRSISSWDSVNAFGRYFAHRLKVSTGTAGFKWNSTTYMVQSGGIV